MEILLQRTEYAKITYMKNYVNIQDKEKCPPRPPIIKRTNRFIREMAAGSSKTIIIPPGDRYFNKPSILRIGKPTNKGNSKFFKLEEDIDEYFVTSQSFYTTKQKHIVRNYNNPFAEVELNIIERKIKRKGDKVYVKIYNRTKLRTFNSRYFRKMTDITTMSFNMKTGNIIVGTSETWSRGRRRGPKGTRFYQNFFFHIQERVKHSRLFQMSELILNEYSRAICNEHLRVMNDNEFINTFLNAIGIEETVPNNCDGKKFVMDKIGEFFVTRKKIKVPNNYKELLFSHYPTEKYLKKNGRKLLQSVLDKMEINSKFTVKLIHKHPKIDLIGLKNFITLLGNDYGKFISNIKQYILNSEAIKSSGWMVTRDDQRNPLLKSEKENIIKIINEVGHDKDKLRRFLSFLDDHYRMLENIREYYPDRISRATTYETYMDEHNELAKIDRRIRKGWTTEYVFDNRMTRLVESPISITHEDTEYLFNPVILKTTEDYDEEGERMNHCVASYSTVETSLIVSLRLDDDSERVTCEYFKKTGSPSQERTSHNRMAPKHFEPALKILRERVLKFGKKRLLDHLEMKKTKIKLNGKEIPTKPLPPQARVAVQNPNAPRARRVMRHNVNILQEDLPF